MKVLKNPSTGSPISTIVKVGGESREYKIKVGETLAFEDEVADTLKSIYGFLEEVEIPQVPSGGKFKCPHCEFTNATKVAVLGHMRTHKGLEERGVEIESGSSAVSDVPEAQGKPVLSPLQKREIERAKESGGEIPEFGKDKDGVPWYGPGLEDDDLASG